MSWGWRYSGPGIVYCASISAAVTWWIGTRERPCGIRGGPRTGAVGSAISCGAKALRICWPLGTGGLCTVKPFWWQNCGISGCGHLRKGICGPIISRWKRAGSTATRCFPIRRPFCGNLRNPIRPRRHRLPYRILFRHAYGRLLPIMRGPFFCARFSPVSGRIARRAP